WVDLGDDVAWAELVAFAVGDGLDAPRHLAPQHSLLALHVAGQALLFGATGANRRDQREEERAPRVPGRSLHRDHPARRVVRVLPVPATRSMPPSENSAMCTAAWWAKPGG